MSLKDTAPHTYKGITPSYFIGLGNAGSLVVSMLEELVERRFSPPDRPVLFRFLRLDSGINNSRKTIAYDYLDVTEKLQEILDGPLSRKFADWLPESLRFADDPSGESLTRMAVRAGFLGNSEKIAQELNDSLTFLSAPERAAEHSQEITFEVDEAVTVYLFAPLWDNVATGMLWDLGLFLEKELSSRPTAKLLPFFLYPSLNAGEEEQRDDELLAITEATLREMSIFRQAGRGKASPAEGNAEVLKHYPFDAAYLVSSGLPGREGWLDATLSCLRRYFTLELDPYFAPALKGAREQLTASLPAAFLEYSLAEIVFPSEDIAQWCTRKLCHKALWQWGKKESAKAPDELLARFYRILDVRNAEKADEEFTRNLGKPRETSWHLGRHLKEVIDQCRKEELLEKLDEEYRRLGVEEVSEASNALEVRVKEIIATHRRLLSKTLMEIAGDCEIGLHRMKSAVSSLGSFLNRCHQNVSRRISTSAIKLDEYERKRLENRKALGRLLKSPLLFLHKAKMMKLYEESWKTCERLFEERLNLHILTTALEYYHSLKEHMTTYKEPVDALMELYELLAKQIDSELTFAPPGEKGFIAFITTEHLEMLYRQFVGNEEKTQCGVISSLLSHIPLDLTDLQNRRVIRDLRNDALQTMYAKSSQCFESVKEISIAEYMQKLLSEPALLLKLKELIEASRAGLILQGDDADQPGTSHLAGFLEGRYPQSDSSHALISGLIAAGAEQSAIIDIQDEHRVISLHQQAGVSIRKLLEEDEWMEHYRRLMKTKHLHIRKDDEKFADFKTAGSLTGQPAEI